VQTASILVKHVKARRFAQLVKNHLFARRIMARVNALTITTVAETDAERASQDAKNANKSQVALI